MADVTDATFEQEVVQRSAEVPVVVDLWAPWCGPCRTLGPTLERVVADTNGSVVLVKVNVDENPQVAAAFQVQSIPAVFALSGGRVVDQFIGALPEAAVREFVGRLAPTTSEADRLVADAAATGDEASLRRALELEPGHVGATEALAALLVAGGESEEALRLLRRVPETPTVRRLLAEARLAAADVEVDRADVTAVLDRLLDRVREDEAARQEFLDLLETLGPDDRRTNDYRKALAARLF